MARRWTPQRFIRLRRIRVIVCVVAVVLSSLAVFGLTARKTVALEINGQTHEVTTYAASVNRLLEEQRVTLRSHDVVNSTSGGALSNHTVVSVKRAYQTTITINGQEVPFWTVANSADELLGFFQQNEHAAARVTVNIGNIYNQLTGGLIINHDGPVTVIADGKTSVAPNGRLPAASILDSKGITLNKEDRVSVERDGTTTILRVQRVTHGTDTTTVSIPFATRTITDTKLKPGQTVIEQKGQNGEERRTYSVTYVDGVAESRKLTKTTTIRQSVERVIAVGPAASTTEGNGSNSQGTSGETSGNGSGGSASGDTSGSAPKSSATPTTPKSTTSTPAQSPTTPSTKPSTPTMKPTTPSAKPTSPSTPTSKPTAKPTTKPTEPSTPSNGSPTADVWHPTPAEAQVYAAGAAAQMGWTGGQWTDLVWLWNHESGWRWWAQNPDSAAYGIPQCMVSSHAACQTDGYHDNARVQIEWGLNYILQRYGSPSQARNTWKQQGWY